MAVRVRLFAALREAAGTGELALEPGRLPALLDVLRACHGDRFAELMAISTALVDGRATPHDAEVDVPDGAELALLPPVSGGAVQQAVACAR